VNVVVNADADADAFETTRFAILDGVQLNGARLRARLRVLGDGGETGGAGSARLRITADQRRRAALSVPLISRKEVETTRDGARFYSIARVALE
jgi:hypothetical protein